MEITQVMGIVYDENELSIEEQNELEEFCFYLSNLLTEKVNQMGLHIVVGGYGNYITKFTKEELENIQTIKQYNASQKQQKSDFTMEDIL